VLGRVRSKIKAVQTGGSRFRDLHRETDRVELGLERGIDHPRAHLDDEAADDRGIHPLGQGNRLAERAWSASSTAARFLSESGVATVTSAVTMPFLSATSARKALIMPRTAKRRRFEATSFRKFAASPLMPARLKNGCECRHLLIGCEDRVAHETVQIRIGVEKR